MATDFGEAIVSLHSQGQPLRFASMQALLIAWAVWIASIPLIGRLADRISPDRIGWPAAIGAQMLAGTGFALVGPTIAVGLIAVLLPPRPVPIDQYYLSVLDYKFVTYFAMYLGCVVVYLVYNYLYESTEIEIDAARASLRASRLERSLTHTRLDRLRKELRPHFLHNSLQSASGLVSSGEYERASRMLDGLDQLLSASLSGMQGDVVSLGEELKLVRTYLSIEGIRFEDRMAVEIDVADELRSALIPPLVLQPLVENAVLHGVADTAERVTITVRAEAATDRLRLVVENDGVRGDVRGAARRGGIGLSNTAERLHLLYGAEACLDFRIGNGRARVVIELPLRRQWEEDDAIT